MTIQEITTPADAFRSKNIGMRTRIREFRKLRGFTLKQMAGKLNTTPQTVQRLETANMTVSTSWLEKFALALSVEPSDLLGARSKSEIQLIGYVDERGRINHRANETSTNFHIEVLADDPVAVRVEIAAGPYEAGTVLIAGRFRDEDIENAHGKDCLVGLVDGPVLLRRVIRGRNKGWTLVPHENGGEVQYDRPLAWVARIVMALRYF